MSQFSLVFVGSAVETMGVLIVSSSLIRSGCPGFMPGLNGVTNGAGVFLFGPVPIRCTTPALRAGVVNEDGPAVEGGKCLSITGDAVMGVEARGCWDPAVAKVENPPSLPWGLRGDADKVALCLLLSI